MVKPGERMTVIIRGPAGDHELPFDDAIFGGPARSESRNYWVQREGAEEVRIPDVEKFGEKSKATGVQKWEDLPAGSSLEGLLLPTPPGKDYRLLKVLTQSATEDQVARLENDRAPVLTGQKPRHEVAGRVALPKKPEGKRTAVQQAEQTELPL